METSEDVIVGGVKVRHGLCYGSNFVPEERCVEVLTPQYFRIWPHVEIGSFLR